MRKKLLTLTIIASSFAFGACTEDSTMDELLKEDIELNETGDPDPNGDDGDIDPPPPPVGG